MCFLPFYSKNSIIIVGENIGKNISFRQKRKCMKIIGRKKEQELLRNYLNDNKSNFIVVTGRRRI
jgi:hypothetical protein